MKIFVINLKRAVKRRKSIEKQLKLLNLEYEMTEAIDGIVWGKEKMAQFITPNLIDSLPSGHLACSLSHYFLYKRIVNENIRQALILEDDVVLSDDMPEILNYFDTKPLKPQELTLLHMQVMYGTSLLNKKSVKINQEKSAYYMKPPEGGIGSTAAYIITKETAQKKLQDFPISFKVDSWVPMMRKGIFDYLLCIYPYPVIPAMFSSDINYISEKSFRYRLKNMANNLPIISNFLKAQRMKTWKARQKNITFSNEEVLPARELYK